VRIFGAAIIGHLVTIRFLVSPALLVAVTLLLPSVLDAQTLEKFVLRGHALTLRLYGPRSGDPVVLASGDGGWIHLGPQVAKTLADRGYFVVGLDTRAYLSSFTSGKVALRPEDEPGDFRRLAEFASHGSGKKTLLVGVSEGAGLSVLAATDPSTKAVIKGVVGLGLPDQNELGWRWKDWAIYLTHGTPDEPMFSTVQVIARMAPVPLAAIHSTHDEYVPREEIQRVFQAAAEPKKLWIVNASNHRFSDNRAEFDQRLFDALAWIAEHQPR
jgi:alpha-beta hydrolase superfamily lysophospholipase